MRLDADKAYATLISSGEDWADKNAAANLLEETKKSVLSRLKNESGAKSDAAKETEALSHPEYQQHVETMVEARRVADRARVKYDSVKILTELRRSEESTRRAEAQIR